MPRAMLAQASTAVAPDARVRVRLISALTGAQPDSDPPAPAAESPR
jgi:hypothetical protein